MARRALVANAASHIERDARGRTDDEIRGVDCSPFPASLGNAELAADLAPAGGDV